MRGARRKKAATRTDAAPEYVCAVRPSNVEYEHRVASARLVIEPGRRSDPLVSRQAKPFAELLVGYYRDPCQVGAVGLGTMVIPNADFISLGLK